MIVPALIPQSSEHLAEALSEVSLWSAVVQVDIVDGVFVPHTSWPYTGGALDDIAVFSDILDIEVDLMIDAPERVIAEYLSRGVRRVVIHLESTRNVPAIVALKQRYDFKLGFSIGNDTPLAVLEDVIGYADYAQLMGIADIGSQGQPFDERVLERISILKERHTALPISIDGSVNAETLPLLVAAGADRFVVGSAILAASDPREAFLQLSAHISTEFE
jgi:ribulose-phosphate 3-epimerase